MMPQSSDDPLIQELIRTLNLTPLPGEGGLYAETYRSSGVIPGVPGRDIGPRSCCTAIYYLVTPGGFSSMHRVASTEIFHFYMGDPVRMLQICPDGQGRILNIGTDIAAEQRPQVVVPRGIWQGTRLAPGGRYALLGCTVSPGFDFHDYQQGRRATLTALCPEFAEEIAALTYE
jgi:predicted cupin superfamily sugar epimerase